MRSFLNKLSSRDRRALLSGTAALLALLLYAFLWEPFINNYHERKKRIATLTTQRDWMLGAAAEVKSLRAAPRGGNESAPTANLLSLVDRGLRQSALYSAGTQVEPEGRNGVKITFKDVDFNALIRWLGQLESSHGVPVRYLDVESLDKPGQVKARCGLGEN